MLSTLLATDDGIATGHITLADVFFLLAFVLFVIGAIIAWAIQPRALWATAVSVGLALLALGWFVL
jgi:hypothetical protein